MWERFLAAGSSLCGAIAYVVGIRVLVGNTDPAPPVAAAAILLGLWVYVAIATKFFDDMPGDRFTDLSGSDALVEFSFRAFAIPGIVIFCLGGIVLIAPLVIPIIFLVALIGKS